MLTSTTNKYSFMTLNKEVIFFRSDIPEYVYNSLRKNAKTWIALKNSIISHGYIVILLK